MSDPRAPALAIVLEAEELRRRGPAACLGERPIILEIGFGRAELISEMAREDESRAYLGVEVSRKRVAKAARRIARLGIPNIRLVQGAAEYLVERVLPASCVRECWINFPDPWPKKRHWRRRLFQAAVLRDLARVLEPGAVLHAATDHGAYAEWIAERLEAVSDLENMHAPARWSDVRPDRMETAYEAEWLAEGRRIAYFEYRRR